MFDPDRLAALASYDILDTAPESGFDDIVRLTTFACDVPVALVSLVDRDRQWFKARVGFEPCQTDLASSVCAHALVQPDLLIIPDLTRDPRTAANPLVTGEPNIRFYAGAPLRTSDGHVLGSLCAIDGEPRPQGLTEKQADALRSLASQVVSQLELRRAIVERERLLALGAAADARRLGLFEIGERIRDLKSVPEIVRVAAEIVGRMLGASRVGFGYLDAAVEEIDVVADWTVPGMASIVGRHRFDDYGELLNELRNGDPLIVEDVRTDPRTAFKLAHLLDVGIAAMVNLPVREQGKMVALLIVHHDAPRTWSPEMMTFLGNVADRLQAGVARLRAEEQQQVLNEELSHRMKNMMAMIQAIAVQTLKTVPDRAPVEALMKRIHALSAAHDVLLRQSWTAADLSEVAVAVLATFDVRTRLDLSGPAVDLGPRTTLSFSLLLHELATNAVKYGALSVDEGRIAIGWRIETHDGAPGLVLDWREIGGPPAREPEGRGFGSRLIGMGLTGTGGVALRYPPTGLAATFRAPLDEVQQS